MTEKSSREANIFFVETNFQKMARRPGGMPRDNAIKNAQANIETLKKEFPNWLEDKLEELLSAIRLLETNPNDQRLIQEAHLRCSHLQDVGSTMGYELITFIARIMCEYFESVLAGIPYSSETVNLHVDAITLASKPPYCHLRPDQLPEMTRGLRRVVERAKFSAE
ncbi:MAG TPA: hypothetical protein VNL39_09695 [Xanthobacteraceae bacterium]|nr:hypothetical protein [Xanthobacteraceae bacterium]